MRANETPIEQRETERKVPLISLPKGGGVIRGIGEKFAANPVTRTGFMRVPIATSPGRLGFGPQLSLSYDSGAANSAFGFGWILSPPRLLGLSMVKLEYPCSRPGQIITGRRARRHKQRINQLVGWAGAAKQFRLIIIHHETHCSVLSDDLHSR
jgi:hypothetical protein